MKKYTLNEFIELYRPDGKGHIVVGDSDIVFNEVVCDSCNDLITQLEDKPDEKVIWVDEGWGLCERCYSDRIRK